MILLKRNLEEFEYLPYEGESDLDAETGLHTGEPEVEYGEPVTYEGNMSTASQYLNQTDYGRDTRYTHVLLVDDPDADIDEHGLVRWHDELYEIRAVRHSLNVLSLRLRRLTRNHAEGDDE